MRLLERIMCAFKPRKTNYVEVPNKIVRGAHICEGYIKREIGETVFYTSSITRKLLLEKGFSNTIHSYIEKHVLLGTEISELADAIKKGKGEDYEGEELADIAIRACNFVCCDEVYQLYTRWYTSNNYSENETDIVQVTIWTHHVKDTVDMKYAVLGEMMSVVEEIKRKSIDIANLITTNLTYTEELVDLIHQLIALCVFYSETFLSENLQDYIDRKMRYNFKRPYKYNTYEEVSK